MTRFSRIVNVLFTLLAVLLVVAILGGVYLVYRARRQADQAAAADALSRARQVEAKLEADARSGRFADDLKKGRDSMGDGEALLGDGRFKESLAASEEAMGHLRPVEGYLETPRESARIEAVSGALTRGTGEAVEAGAPLQAGETLVVPPGGRALVVFPSREAVLLESGTRLMVSSLTAGPSQRCVECEIISGSLVYRCPPVLPERATGSINAAGALIRPEPGSMVFVGREGSGATVEAREGRCKIEEAGGTRSLRAGLDGEAVRLGGAGAEPRRGGEVPPLVRSPAEGRVFWAAPGRSAEVTVSWELSRSAACDLQVSRSPLFVGGAEIQRTVSGSSTRLASLGPGTYFLRVRAAGGASGSFWSWPLRFRVVENPPQAQAPADWKLDVDATPLGDGILVEGRVSPVVWVTVNDVEVEVESDGRFAGTFGALPGAGGERTVTVKAFDGEGHQKLWTKNF